MEEKRKCKARVSEHLKGRLQDLQRLWKAYCKDGEGDVEDLGNIFEYGLCFDYVALGTFGKQRKGYFRYQLSWGGPSDEFRFFCGPELQPYRIEYWFMDWFDGARRILKGKNEILLLEIWEWFKEGGAIDQSLKDSQE